MIFAWIGAALIGISLGLLGSGGSILTVPVLVYLVGEPEKLAIAESLAIVGGISLFGAIPYALKKQIDWRSVLWFGIPGVLGTYGGAALSVFLSGVVQLMLFATVMLVAAVMMFRPTKASPEGSAAHKRSPVKIALEGLSVGVLTGLVGVGGGFLIIPALVLLGGLPMGLAVGTSLLIIAAKSFAGFYKYVHVLAEHDLSVNWGLIGLFTIIGIAGSFLGARVGKNISNDSLKRGFAGFLVVMGAYVLATNVPKVLHPTPVAEARHSVSTTH
ncbi:sulfite exporter TauE/SafE family protein (plasmid) [Deinococcus taeanensis]|uniref:sulfite exporter TauE/SafE family protein n=1 Tax=Deinococcus taeanensis TaxID=2737050 RepID=UPI001CDCB6D9|nr:sulfite exporter TauE/SafE family protein [Deinococcus taeanensis]UBV44147.1 sulfite exporter TauE/SafE family protein [Deinococcus taeanensis]